MQARVIAGKDVLHLSELRDEMIDILFEEYHVEATNYRNQSLKKRLQQKFGNLISFWHPNKWRYESEMVYSNEVPSGMFVEACLFATRDINNEEEASEV